METIVVTSERGEVNVLDRPMTVTGFNATMIEELGIPPTTSKCSCPACRSATAAKAAARTKTTTSICAYMRGIGSQRTVNSFSDTSVAVYIDGVWTDQTYATDGLFDVERVEVARGPQGTTGGGRPWPVPSTSIPASPPMSSTCA